MYVFLFWLQIHIYVHIYIYVCVCVCVCLCVSVCVSVCVYTGSRKVTSHNINNVVKSVLVTKCL